MKIWMITVAGNDRPLHIASTPEKAQAFAKVYLHSNLDEGFHLSVRPMQLDGNLDADETEWLANGDPDVCMLMCDFGLDLHRGEMVEMATGATDTDWFCSECAAKRTKLETDAYDDLSDRFTGEPCLACGCHEFTAVEHMGSVLFGCDGDDCVMDVLANVAVTELRKRYGSERQS